ncbi:MAG: AlkZ family DNA glycosylase [Bacteroidetes bacterium]|nr:AlkZ family DNA glycosylase [Bacteroidota bacterium]
MTPSDLLKYRLHNQHISQRLFTAPGDIVTWLGAVQAQDYSASKWALGLRLQNNTDNDIDKALADGSIIRTHVLRPTWHLVPPADVRWMLQLTAPRIKRVAGYMHQLLQLDKKIFTKATKVLVKALEGGACLSRTELVTALDKAKIATNELRFVNIMMQAELDGIICSGPRIGKQFSYGLLDERVPPAKPLARDEALAKLALRYFTSHGPATLKDFAWWSGLTLADAKDGIEMIKDKVTAIRSQDISYWAATSSLHDKPVNSSVHLLPAFDEYLVSYADRSVALHAIHNKKVVTVNGIFFPVIIVNGKVVGTWKKLQNKRGTNIDLSLFESLAAAKLKAISAAAKNYGKYMGLPVVVK